jgi:hypothetical protein
VKRTAVLLLTAVAFALRLAYLLHSHPFIDEFTTVLASRAILLRGLPVLPSGLFYEHGLLFSYLDVPFVAMAGEGVLFDVARLPSLLVGTATVPLLYWVGRRWVSPRAGLIAAALLAFSPEGMVWGGRARMYALAQFLALLLALLVYEGSRGEVVSQVRGTLYKARCNRYRVRWLSLLVLLATLLTQFGALILVPPLLVGALVAGWLMRPEGARPWFTRRAALVEGVGLVAVVGLGVLTKRLGRPLGAAPLGGNTGELLEELIGTVTYQAGLALDGESTLKFLARQFGVPHHLWLTLIALIGGLLSLAIWLRTRKSAGRRVDASSGQGQSVATEWRDNEAVTSTRFVHDSLHSTPPEPRRGPISGQGYSLLYLWLVFGLTVVEMVVLLEPWRRNPRYLVMVLPLFYLIVAASIERIAKLISGNQGIRESPNLLYLIPIFIFVGVQAGLLVPDLRVAYRTPEPAYEEAFRYVADEWQAGDILLTMNTSGAGLFLGPVDHSAVEYGFAIQEDAEQFLLDADTQPVDRWLGVPWVGTAADFNRALNENRRAWFVVDTIRLPVYYRGDWLAILESQMDLVWSQDDALIYLTRPGRTPIPSDPDISLDVRFGNIIRMNGYSVARGGNSAGEAQAGRCENGQPYLKPGDNLQVTFFWQALAPVDVDYTVFLHVRNEQGVTVAQRDSQPYDGLYPTSRWRLGETVPQSLDVELPLDLAAGAYSVYVGLYRLDTMTRLSLENDSSGENAFILGETIQVASDE